MRRDPTWAEFRLWQALRRNQMGVRFRRQPPIGPYIVDFVCLSRKVIVEADGFSHAYNDLEYSRDRDRFLRERGYAVLHFEDDTINHHLDDALAVIGRVLDDPTAQWNYADDT